MKSNHATVLKQLGAVIARQRKAVGLSQKELGELAGVGINFVGQIESGKPTAQLSKVLDVTKALGLQLTVQLGKSTIEIKYG